MASVWLRLMSDAQSGLPDAGIVGVNRQLIPALS
jgi:hypothetical protein